MKNIILSIGALLIFLCPFGAVGQNNGTLKGKVSDAETGQSISNAQIHIEEIHKGAVTSADGSYIIKDILPGKYTVELKALGYSGIKKEVVIETGKTTELSFDIEMTPVTFNEVTISATKLSTTINKIGSPVYLIGNRVIEETERRNIEESLFRVPGVFTEDRHHGEANVVSFRGIGLHTHVTRGILVLVDGVPVNEADGRTSFEGIDMENAKSIEVLKGPVSAMYGPNGITGVINIKEIEPKKGFHGRITARVGSYNTQKIAGNINGGTDDFKYMVKGGYYTSEGYQDRSAYSSARAGVKISNNFHKAGKVTFTADYIQTSGESSGPLDSAQFADRSRISTNKFTGSDKNLHRINLIYNKAFSSSTDFQVNAYQRGRHDKGHYLDRLWSEDKINLLGGEARLKQAYTFLGKSNAIVIGTSFDNETGTNEEFLRDEDTGIIGEMNDKGESIYQMIGLYAENELMLSEKLTITLGLRFDQVSYDWKDLFNTGEDNTSASKSVTALSPKLGFAYNPTSTLTVFGNASKGFNPPLITQLFIGSSYSGLANSDLKPEYLSNYEIGLRGAIATKFTYQLSFFLMDFKDQIATEIDTAISNRVPVYKNIGKTRHQGIELAGEYQFNRQLSAFVSYAYLDAKFVDYVDFTGNQLSKAPHNKANAGISYAFNFGLTASFDFVYVGSYFMDNENVNEYEGYSLLNAKLNYQRKGWNLGLGIENITNVNYATWAYASESYNPQTHQTSWEQMYYPGWPVNLTLSLGYRF